MSRFDLTLNWLILLIVTALAAFSLGMLFAQVEFDAGRLFSILHPGALTAIGVGFVFYVFWLVKLVRLTRRSIQH